MIERRRRNLTKFAEFLHFIFLMTIGSRLMLRVTASFLVRLTLDGGCSPIQQKRSNENENNDCKYLMNFVVRALLGECQ